MKVHTVSWFSAGVSSAVATKLMIAEIDEIIYTHIEDQHPDTMRFVRDCEKWFERPITILQSPYKNVENALTASSYICGPHGSPCTRLLKRRVRQEWEMDRKHEMHLQYVWGMDSTESHRLERLRERMQEFYHLCPLVEKKINKAEAHEILAASGIRRPAMYELGYHNNNCVGCVKGGKGYWNKIRQDFPDVFQKRAELERRVGASCINGVFLDELDPESGRHDGPICDDCGLFCQLMAI